MTARERFMKAMHFQPVDRVPYWVPWWWEETLQKWAIEGHPDITEKGEEKKFGCDRKVHVRMWLNFEPPFDEDVLAEDDEYITVRTKNGIIQKSRKDKLESSPIRHPIRYPIETLEDYLKYRPHLTGQIEARLARVKNLKNHVDRDYVLSLRGTLDCGFYGPLRDLVGFEKLSMLFYDDPTFIEMMMDDRAELIIQMIEAVLNITDIDWFCFWEDMAYKNGPMISPELFRKFMIPKYRRVTDVLHKHGVDLIFVDSDGDISLLIPLWIECGVNGMWPLEVQAGMDVVKLHREYGKDLLLMGGLDKREMTKGKKAIENEILKKVPPLIEDGGYVPRPDHSIPPDVSYENYCYYMEFLRKVLEKG